MRLRGDHPNQRHPPPEQHGRVLLQPEHLHPEAVRLLLREVALRLSCIPGLFQGQNPATQGVGKPLQRVDAPIRRPLSLCEQPADPRRYRCDSGSEQLGRERGQVEIMHEASMSTPRCDDTHASGAYIIGMTRFPPPPAGMFATTVLFGHISTVAPSEEPSVFSRG